MRDFRDAKAMARTLRQALAAKGVRLTNSEALELVARMLGERDWNTLTAAIEAAAKAAEPAPPPASKPPEPPQAPASPAVAEPTRRRTGTYFSSGLEATLHRAVGLAAQRKHEYTTLEHLLVALIDDPDALQVLEACAVDIPTLGATTLRHIDEELASLVREDGANHGPTAGFHRVVQRAVIHVQSAGRDNVTGANVLVAIFSERESRACQFLEAQNLTRYDAVNFIAHGVRKDGGKAA